MRNWILNINWVISSVLDLAVVEFKSNLSLSTQFELDYGGAELDDICQPIKLYQFSNCISQLCIHYNRILSWLISRFSLSLAKSASQLIKFST